MLFQVFPRPVPLAVKTETMPFAGHREVVASPPCGQLVYLGTAKDGGQVAIKMLRPELADDGEGRARFRREAFQARRAWYEGSS
jgi:hypothetical protein